MQKSCFPSGAFTGETAADPASNSDHPVITMNAPYRNPLGKTIPILALTVNAFSSDVQACLDAGMNAHVAKPIDIATLERTLKSVLGTGKKQLACKAKAIK